MGRVTVSDPTAAANALDKLSTTSGGPFKTASLKRVPGGWEYVTKHSALPVLLVGNQLVVGKASVGDLKPFASRDDHACSRMLRAPLRTGSA